MPQLVGQPCSLCGERVGSDLDARFCPRCHNPTHDRCRKSETANGFCPDCGTNLETASRRARETDDRRRQEQASRPPPPPLDVERAYRAYRLGRVLLGGAIAVNLGVIAFAIGEPAAGVGAVVVGLTLFAFAAYSLRG